MKQFTGKKHNWILCTALMLALGSNNYFQVQSTNIDSIELSSLGDTPEGLEEAKKILAASEKETKEHNAKKYAEAQAAIELKILASKKEENKSDDLKLYDFYKSHEATQLGLSNSVKDFKQKEIHAKAANAANKRSEQLIAKISAENKENKEFVTLYKIHKKEEMKLIAEFTKETDTAKKEALAKELKSEKALLSTIALNLKAPGKKVEAKAVAKVEVKAETKVETKVEPKVEAKEEQKVETKTQTTAGIAETCPGGCGPSDKMLEAAIKIVQAQEAADAKKAKEAQEAKEVAEKETPKEKREREAQAKKDAKEAKETAKREKAEAIAEAKREKAEDLRTKRQEEKVARNEDFAERVKGISENCKEDIGCSVAEFSMELDRFSGDKKIDTFAVNKAFNQFIAKDLKAALSNPETVRDATDALYLLTSEVPKEYRFIKEKAIDLAKYEAMAHASSVNDKYRMADQLTKANRPIEASNYLIAANQGARQFVYETDMVKASVIGGANVGVDRTTLDYLAKSYIPDMEKLKLDLMNPAGIKFDKLGETSLRTNTSSTLEKRASSRVSRGGNTTSVFNGKTISNNTNGGTVVENAQSSERGSRRGK